MSSSCLLISKLIMLLFVMSKPIMYNSVNSVAVGLYGPDRYEGIPEICLLPMDMGYCRAKVKRYYFDIRRMKCSMFYWGGCAGNDNNFNSVDECNEFCSPIEEETNSVAGAVVRQNNKQKLEQDQYQRPNQHHKQHIQYQHEQQLVRQQLQRQQKLRDYDFIENNQYSKYAEYDKNKDRGDNFSANTRTINYAVTRTTPKYTSSKLKGTFKGNDDSTLNTTLKTTLKATLNGTEQTGSTKSYPLNASTRVASYKTVNSNDNSHDYDN